MPTFFSQTTFKVLQMLNMGIIDQRIRRESSGVRRDSDIDPIPLESRLIASWNLYMEEAVVLLIEINLDLLSY